MPASSPNPLHNERALARLGKIVQQKYRINRLLGIGGMAAVYAATHQNGHRVAIKFLLDHLLHDPDLRKLFTREAYVANRVDHPGAVPVLDNDPDEEGCPFLIMPLLEGETLRARWERANKRLPLAEVCMVTLEVLAVLGAAHAKGIIHRDIKLDNVFLTSKGDVRVLDFGIARRGDGDGTTTVAGRMIGTPAFMPPEQALGDYDAIGPHSDTWAVGAMMFTALSGEYVHAVSGGGAFLAAAATRRARSIAEVAPELPPAIVDLVNTALAFEPAARWGSSSDMREALVQAAEGALGEPIAAVTQRVRVELVASLANAGESGGEETRPPERIKVTPIIPATLPTLPRRRFSWGLGLAVSGALLVGGIVFATSGHKAASKGAPNSVSQVENQFSSQQENEPGPSPAALEHFNAGVQLWRDISYSEAQERFENATDVDPAFARAHLYYVLTVPVPWNDDARRMHYRHALDHRGSLAPSDRAMLDALEPLMQDPSDITATEQRFRRLLESSPNFFVAWTLLRLYDRVDHLKDIIDMLSMTDVRSESPAFAASAIASVAISESRTDDAIHAIQDCLSLSPTSGSCWNDLTVLQAHDGLCAQAEASSRQWIASWPNSATAYHFLASSIYGRTGSIEGARTALERKWSLLKNDEREMTRIGDSTNLAVLAGDVVAARRNLDEWERLAASSPDARIRAEPATLRLDLEYEVSSPETVRALTKRYLEQSAAWTASPWVDFRATADRMLLRTGGISEEQIVRERQGWLTIDTNGSYALPARRWFNFFAEMAITPHLASDAVAHLPLDRPFFDPYACDNDCDETVGETFSIAGDPERALPHLRRAANACAIDFPIQSLRARYLLGRTLESQGRIKEACDAYRRVLLPWAKLPVSRLMRDTRLHATQLGCDVVLR